MESLNEQQRQVVVMPANCGVVQVSAAPGSGKTRVVAHRVAYLVNELKVEPSTIICMTFSNKAAAEMRERVALIVGNQVLANRVMVTTFHSWGGRLLRRHGGLWKPPVANNFTILDAADMEKVLKNAAKKLPFEIQWDRKSDEKLEYPPGPGDKVMATPGRVKSAIEEWRRTALTPAEVLAHGRLIKNKFDAWVVYPLWVIYEREKQRMDACDFADLLALPVRILDDHPDLSRRLSAQFRAVLVDELQDTNEIQFRMVRHLVAVHKNLIGVGDMNQSIYSWRGAQSVENVRSLRQMNARIIRLSINYRSTKSIVALCAEILKDMARSARESCDVHTAMETVNPAGPRPVFTEHKSANEEAGQVIKEITALHAKSEGIIDWDSFAILTRTGAAQRAFEDCLLRADVPYVTVGGISFYERAEIKDLTSYLTLVSNPNNDEALVRVITVPRRNVGPKLMEKLQNEARDKEISLFKVIEQKLANRETIGTEPATENLERFVALIHGVRHRLVARTLQPHEVLALLVAVIEFKEYLKHTYKENWPDRWENAGELAAMLRDDRYSKSTLQARKKDGYQNSPGLSDAEELLSMAVIDLHTMSAMSRARKANSEEQEPAVVLSTLHSSKGLEWPVVFVGGCSEANLPHFFARSVEQHAEEHRLFFVGCSRAEMMLRLTRSKMSSGWNPKLVDRSPFLGALDVARVFDDLTLEKPEKVALLFLDYLTKQLTARKAKREQEKKASSGSRSSIKAAPVSRLVARSAPPRAAEPVVIVDADGGVDLVDLTDDHAPVNDFKSAKQMINNNSNSTVANEQSANAIPSAKGSELDALSLSMRAEFADFFESMELKKKKKRKKKKESSASNKQKKKKTTTKKKKKPAKKGRKPKKEYDDERDDDDEEEDDDADDDEDAEFTETDDSLDCFNDDLSPEQKKAPPPARKKLPPRKGKPVVIKVDDDDDDDDDDVVEVVDVKPTSRKRKKEPEDDDDWKPKVKKTLGRGRARPRIKREVKEEMMEEVKVEVNEEVKKEVKEEMKEEVKKEVKKEVKEEVKEEVDEEEIAAVKAEVKEEK